jgi:hypothetical protein
MEGEGEGSSRRSFELKQRRQTSQSARFFQELMLDVIVYQKNQKKNTRISNQTGGGEDI